MQYFSGYSSFSDEEPLHHCLIVELRKRLGLEQINAINEKILLMAMQQMEKKVAEVDKLIPADAANITVGN